MSWAATFRAGQRPDRVRENFARVVSLLRRGYVTFRLLWCCVYRVDCFVRERRDLSGSRLCGCCVKCTVFKSPPGRSPRRDLSVDVASSADTGGPIRLTDTAAERVILSAHGRIGRGVISTQNWQSRIVWDFRPIRNLLSRRCRKAVCTRLPISGTERIGIRSPFWSIWPDAKIRRCGLSGCSWGVASTEVRRTVEGRTYIRRTGIP